MNNFNLLSVMAGLAFFTGLYVARRLDASPDRSRAGRLSFGPSGSEHSAEAVETAENGRRLADRRHGPPGHPTAPLRPS